MTRAALVGLATLALLGAVGCGTSHQLQRAVRMPAPRPGCSIGVGPIVDGEGVDHALDLRDYLRKNGPCSRVVAVSSEDADVDVVVRGTVRAQLTPESPNGQRAAGQALGVGLAGLIVGPVLMAVARKPSPDDKGFTNPAKVASYEGMRSAGVISLVAGAAVTGVAAALMAIDGAAVRDLKLGAVLDAELVFLRGGAPVANATLHDDVVVHGRHPRGRPEARESWAAHGPLYREALERVFEHVAEQLGDLVGPR